MLKRMLKANHFIELELQKVTTKKKMQVESVQSNPGTNTEKSKGTAQEEQDKRLTRQGGNSARKARQTFDTQGGKRRWKTEVKRTEKAMYDQNIGSTVSKMRKSKNVRHVATTQASFRACEIRQL